MNDVNPILGRLKLKIQKVLNDYNSIVNQNNELINENKHLLKIIDEQKEFINNIEEKNKILKIASSINSKENSKEVKLKINEFLREIDKCIALLNK